MKLKTYLTLVAFLVFGAGIVAAQDQSKGKVLTVMGPVKSVQNGSFSVDANKTTMTFAIDADTSVLAKGATAKTRAKKAAGQGGLTIADLVHEGDQVLVRYVEVGGRFVAGDIEVRQARPASAQKVK